MVRYKGKWGALTKELLIELDKVSFDVNFTNDFDNSKFTIKGENIGLRLKYPWIEPNENDEIDNNVLVVAKFKKGENPQLETFIEAYYDMQTTQIGAVESWGGI